MRLRILILALGTFAIGTDGFVIAGILPNIAHELSISLAFAGLFVTTFSLTYALGAPVLAALTGNLARRRVLLVALVVFVLANGLAAAATHSTILLIARMLAAVSAALYTPTALAVAATLAPQEKRGQALSLVTAGITVATVAGVPVGILISTQWNWRMTFVLVALLGALAFVGVLVLLPRVASPAAVNLRTRLALLRQPVLVLPLVNALVWTMGGFTVYTYLSPFLQQMTHVQGAGISAMFLVFGVAGVLGNALGGYGADHWGAVRTLVWGLIGAAAALLALPLVSGSVWAVGCVVGVWGIAGWSLNSPQQHRLITLAPSAVNIILSLNNSALYLGIGAGAALGGWVVQDLSFPALGWVGGVLDLLALVVLWISVWLVRRTTRQRVQAPEQAVMAHDGFVGGGNKPRLLGKGSR